MIIVAGQTGLPGLTRPVHPAANPATTEIQPRPFSYRAVGEFLRDGVPVDGPLVQVENPALLTIMTYQVSTADYAQCVTDGACRSAEPRRPRAGEVPVTGVSFNDAQAYADWLSQATGQHWRLPTIQEWAFAAGSRAVDHALPRPTDAANPADRWLLAYKQASALSADGAAAPEVRGSFGVNELGVADLAGTLWEWTASCNSRVILDGENRVVSTLESCGVRYLEGRHRTPMSAFVRDARGGGCSAGLPPDNLGFRLVRERNWSAALLDLFR
ncbi:MAG TPA: SUMF1/EgtB/PvdO family nonheme iron enzyme [Devosia sp.]|nr:SUMF1/EgtB/PvdO family nonheme iron enzyme [Devosia sp.]